MTIRDTDHPGKFWASDTLKLTVNVTIGGRPASQGDTQLTTSDPKEPSLCGIVMGESGHSCNVDFPHPGRWIIVAKYEGSNAYPPRFVASKAIAVLIRSPGTASTPTTLPKAPVIQSTSVSAKIDELAVSGGYTMLFYGKVVVANSESQTPGAGAITFYADGVYQCEAIVTVLGTAECSGLTYPATIPGPYIAYYSGTNAGIDDGTSSDYARSSAIWY